MGRVLDNVVGGRVDSALADRLGHQVEVVPFGEGHNVVDDGSRRRVDRRPTVVPLEEPVSK